MNNLDSTPAYNNDHVFWEYFDSTTSDTNEPMNDTLPRDVIAAREQGFVVGIYSLLLVIGAVGNVAVFTSLIRSRRRKSRVNLLMTHLAVADLFVTFIVIPLEIGWKTTNAWLAGNMACKFFLVMRAFGLYLSSNVLVCISLDRFFAVVYPLRLPIARKRSKLMLSLAWLVAIVCSFPQSLVFSVKSHPRVSEFEQCVSFDAFPDPRQELAYNVFCLCAMYFLPLLVITACYLCIFYEISKSSKEINDNSNISINSRVMLRRSDERPLARARRRTLRMTVTIVTVFACCWLPYATMTLWYMIDRQSAQHVSQRLQELFFIMAVSNSCMDPLVYGSYALDVRSIVARAMRKILCLHHKSPVTTTSAPGTSKNITGRPVASLKQNQKLCHSNRHRFAVRFEETSMAGPSSALSDPSPCWPGGGCRGGGGGADQVFARAVRPSRSCDVFVMEVRLGRNVCSN